MGWFGFGPLDGDTWALENEERKQEMITLKNRVLEN